MHLIILLSVMFVLCSVACARPRTQARRLPAWVFETTRADRPGHHPPVRPRPRGGVRGRSEASDFVVAALQGKGLRFGTDGSVASLWGYLRESQTALPPGASQSGDVLFFQTRTPVPTVSAPAEACNAPDHVAIVSSVDSDGRISFVEARDGEIRHGFADPERPQVRRDETGRVLNTFLHPKDINDAGDVPNFAGEMVCAAVRTKG